jgi:hypothetical protein
MYFSIGDPVWFDTSVNNISDPSSYNFQDVSYYTLYDKCEFSLVSTEVMTPPMTATNYSFTINPTAVDFFCLPINLQLIDSATNMAIPAGNEVSPPISSSGFTQSRASMFSYLTDFISTNDGSTPPVWSNLFIGFLSNPFINPATDPSNIIEYLRFVSPATSVAQPAPPPPPPAVFYENYASVAPFPTNYLFNMNISSYDYVDSVWAFYETNVMNIDASELADCVSPADCYYTGMVDSMTNEFIFTAAGPSPYPLTVSIPKPTTSNQFYSGTLTTPAPPNKTPGAVIARQITSAFDVGILPIAPENIPPYTAPPPAGFLCKAAFAAYKVSPGYYSVNPLWTSNVDGPWYDLYSRSLHSLNEPIYTFAFDDVLEQSGTLSAGGAAHTSGIYALIAIGDLTGTTIPDPYSTDMTSYTVTLQAGANRPVGYRQGSSGPFTSLAASSSITLSGVTSNSGNPFQISLQNDSNMDCTQQILTVYIKYQIVVPQCVSNSSLAKGVVITVPTAMTPSIVTITLPGASYTCPAPCFTPPCPSPCPSPPGPDCQ